MLLVAENKKVRENYFRERQRKRAESQAGIAPGQPGPSAAPKAGIAPGQPGPSAAPKAGIAPGQPGQSAAPKAGIAPGQPGQAPGRARKRPAGPDLIQSEINKPPIPIAVSDSFHFLYGVLVNPPPGRLVYSFETIKHNN